MSRIIKHKEYKTTKVYSLVFPHDQTQVNFPPRGGWFGFDCNEQGHVDRDALNPCARENFDYCCLDRPIWWVEEMEQSGWEPGILQCDCDAEIELYRPGADVSCDKCGREYNSAGQLLAPRSQWGEETGEHASDYDRGFNNPESAFEED